MCKTTTKKVTVGKKEGENCAGKEDDDKKKVYLRD